jgi:broad specificity phosphatase PhoE
MSKPKRIILLRHGQSILNVDKSVCKDTPDYACGLTDLGKEQAREAGVRIAEITSGGSIRAYYSPYWRTRDTFLLAAEGCNVVRAFEEPRIREQEWNTSFGLPHPDTNDARDSYGHAYFRIPNGESCLDVYDRVSDFIATLHRDFKKEEYPSNCLIVGHGMLNRIFLWRWFHWPIERFEIKANPPNCGIYIMELREDGHYELVTPVREYEKYNHPFQYPRIAELDKYRS